MPGRFEKHFQADASYKWWDTKTNRYYSPQQYELVAWLAAGGVADEVPYVAPPTAEELSAAHQAGKPAALKAAENSLLASLADAKLALPITAAEVAAKVAELAGQNGFPSASLALRLLAAQQWVAAEGGRLNDLPAKAHK